MDNLLSTGQLCKAVGIKATRLYFYLHTYKLADTTLRLNKRRIWLPQDVERIRQFFDAKGKNAECS